jgi:hypothetical protein
MAECNAGPDLDPVLLEMCSKFGLGCWPVLNTVSPQHAQQPHLADARCGARKEGEISGRFAGIPCKWCPRLWEEARAERLESLHRTQKIYS